MANQLPEDGQAGSLVAQAVERMAAAKIAGGPPSAGGPRALRPGAVHPVRISAFRALGVLDRRRALDGGDGRLRVAGSLKSSGETRRGTKLPAKIRLPQRLCFAGYVIVTRVLFLFRLGGTADLGPVAGNLGLLVLAAMCVRAQWKLIEVHLLAREMAGVERMGLERGGP